MQSSLRLVTRREKHYRMKREDVARRLPRSAVEPATQLRPTGVSEVALLSAWSVGGQLVDAIKQRALVIAAELSIEGRAGVYY